MNYYDARQREDTKKWDYTRMNDGHIHPIGYCAEKVGCECATVERVYTPDPECEVCGGRGRVPNPEYCGSHDTPEEAYACFRRYLLADVKEENYGSWQDCEAKVNGQTCDKPTRQGLTARRPYSTGHALCDEHRTPEILDGLTSVGQMISSY